MMTPQDIREKTFEKAVFGGYDMASVDECLEEICQDFAALQKENNTLKAKLKVLATKIEEYRESEDAMRMALLSAQKMGAQIEADAKVKADRMIAEAEAYAQKIVGSVQAEKANEEARLLEAKKVSAQFFENIRLLTQKQMEFLDHVADMKVADVPAAPKAADAETVKVIEDSVKKAAGETNEQLELGLDNIVADVTADSPTRPFTPVKGFSFDDLKYGKE